jgi:uncharacterized protein YjbI with pentapeptide repeats
MDPMANYEHVALLKKGVDAWNAWRRDNPDIRPDLSGAELSEANLRRANLHRTDLTGANLRRTNLSGADLRRAYLGKANLSEANLSKADLTSADLSEANLRRAHLGEANLRRAHQGKANLSEANLSNADLTSADLSEADLRRANLSEANLRRAFLRRANLEEANLRRSDIRGVYLRRAFLRWANLEEANLRRSDLRGAYLRRANLRDALLSRAHILHVNLTEADLRGADLEGATLVDTDCTGANLTGCRVYGISAWNLKLKGVEQQNLIITPEDKPTVTVDKIEVAQFVYLLLHNGKIRDVIDTIGKKGVLLLGRFTEGRIAILERLQEKLRSLGYVPIVFNFDKPKTKDFTETVRLLTNLSHFVIADITNPRSAPLELQATVQDYMVPFATILQKGEQPFSMFVDLQNKYDWVLQPVVGYPSVERLIKVLEDKIVRPAEAKFNELLARRTKQLRVENV